MYERFVKLLRENNVTAYRVSKETGVTQTTLSDWKTGRGTPKTNTLKKIADYFNVSVDWLTGLSNYRNNQEIIDSTWVHDWTDHDYDDYSFDPVFDFCELLQPIRDEQEITEEEMCKVIGVSVDRYIDCEEGQAPLSESQAEKLCAYLGTNIIQVLDSNNLYNGEIPEKYWDNPEEYYKIQEQIHEEAQESIRDYETLVFSQNEVEHIKKYRTLDRHGKKAVDDLLNNEYDRCNTPETPKPTIRVKHSEYKVSAGKGFDLDDRDMWDEIEVPDTPEARRADFSITIKGDSMEPIYHDRDIVLVKIQDRVNIGETGIFIINGSGFIKQYGGDRLISINSDYEDILFSEGDSISCAGKVIGTTQAW